MKEKKYFYPADILLPKNNFERWAVIACDQYTSEPAYWQKTEEIVGENPSALKIILPEVYLEKNNSARIEAINAEMNEYLNSDVFECVSNTMVYVERTLKDGRVRKGLVGLIDLEDYSYQKGADTPIRATEETVESRIPPRVEIRRNATLEIPHIMLLINDFDNSVIEPLKDKTASFEKLYDFSLMQNGGRIKGYALDQKEIANVQGLFSDLMDKSSDGLLFAMGDGNHSLATAKECYNLGIGPRYALVEVVNIHDSSLEFEPIYRVLFGVDPEKVIADILDAFGGQYDGDDKQEFICVYGEKEITLSLKPTAELCVATLQTFLDGYIKENPEIEIDYIHGVSSVRELSKKENTLGFIFKGMEKSELFAAVSADGSLPRKTFSMGCADDKRFYLEARKL
ncbi:MAG: DUF1015 domain-containing protein [Clostridia bacterium]|nr:DUF1015 domain-containing protein [Clostridia bacterium]